MATLEHPAAPALRGGVQPLRAGQGTSFLWRKLHSLLGIVPIGAFLLEHLLSNFEALKGPAAYAAQVKLLNSLPLVRVLEWTFIFLPLLYHGLYGVYIWLRGQSNLVYYPWAGNWMYTSQRWTGIISLLYIGQHVLRQRFLGVSLPEHPGAAFAKVQQELANPWMLAVYVIAMIAVCWHFAYGVWLFAAKWGITPGATARKRFGWACAVGGVLLAAMGLASIWAFIGPNYRNAPLDVPVSMLSAPPSFIPGARVSDRPSGADVIFSSRFPGLRPGLTAFVPPGQVAAPMGFSFESRFFAHHPQTERRLGPRSLRMTAVFMSEIADSGPQSLVPHP